MIFIPARSHAAETDRVHAEDSVEKMLAVSNRLQKVNGWSCSSQLWHPHLLGCDCLSNSCGPRLHNIRPAKAFLAACESFLNCRKCCKSSTSNKQLLFHNFFQTTTKSPRRNEIDICGLRKNNVDNLAFQAFLIVQAWCSVWKRAVTEHTLVGVQQKRWTVVI